jgi:hypothetical protein
MVAIILDFSGGAHYRFMPGVTVTSTVLFLPRRGEHWRADVYAIKRRDLCTKIFFARFAFFERKPGGWITTKQYLAPL